MPSSGPVAEQQGRWAGSPQPLARVWGSQQNACAKAAAHQPARQMWGRGKRHHTHPLPPEMPGCGCVRMPLPAMALSPLTCFRGMEVPRCVARWWGGAAASPPISGSLLCATHQSRQCPAALWRWGCLRPGGLAGCGRQPEEDGEWPTGRRLHLGGRGGGWPSHKEGRLRPRLTQVLVQTLFMPFRTIPPPPLVGLGTPIRHIGRSLLWPALSWRLPSPLGRAARRSALERVEWVPVSSCFGGGGMPCFGCEPKPH